MTLLISTLGTSWQMIAELIGFTNPNQFDFFKSNKEVSSLRAKYNVQPIDECWLITTTGTDTETIKNWCKQKNITARFFICDCVHDVFSQNEIEIMRSFIYRVVLHAHAKCQKLYISPIGGRKPMSIDMYDAANLFGCDMLFHIIDKAGLPDDMKKDSLLADIKSEWANAFMPLIIDTNIKASLIIATNRDRITTDKFQLHNINNKIYCEDGSLLKAIDELKNNSSQLYANFYNRISSKEHAGRDTFKKLYFLHPDIISKIQNYTIGKNKTRDQKIINSLPKTELHSHLGGVLTPEEIIEVALEEKDYNHDDTSNSKKFYEHIQKIISYKDRPQDFKKEIYKKVKMPNKNSLNNNFYVAGIDEYKRLEEYQHLGDYQGSQLLQTKRTIQKTLELYAQKLIKHNVQYVEIRCSPYKYIELGLSIKDVLNTIIDTMDAFHTIEYRLIWIFGRNANLDKINEHINELQAVLTDEKIARKIVGVDLAGNEAFGDLPKLRESFLPLFERCIHVTIHAGETESVNSIWQAAYHLQAERIGHGLTLKDNDNLLKHFIDRGIAIEMCPSSNDQIVNFSSNGELYPLKQYMERGLKVSLNTDDCGISLTDNTKEFIKAASLCENLTLWDCIVLIRNGITSAFCDTETKRVLMHNFEDEILNFCLEEFKE